ncbi:MAG TPA: endonuclease/exonuclease/phosphatase family protein [Tepidisphaeraceae bacterium]|jgi:endonuclease/exonuclease/phosphatase family metal-dependent hydrolase
MRLFSYNILNGGVGRADPIGEVIEAQHADVVVLIEADDAWVVERIAKRLRMDYVIAPGDGHAAAVLSRFPIGHSLNRAMLDSAGPRSWLEVSIEPPHAPPLNVMAIHLHPRATLADEARRTDQLNRVLAVTEVWRDRQVPHVLAGDFNANAPGQKIAIDRCKRSTRAAFAENGQTLPRDAVRLLLDHGYVDTLHAVRQEAALETATFTTHEPGQRVDYVFTHGLGVHDAWVETDRLATYASDHYPVGAELRR